MMRTICFLFCVVTVFCISSLPAFPQAIIGSGCSISNVGYLQELAAEYERTTGTRVFIRGGGSVAGIEDLRSGKVDLAASCRGRLKGDVETIEFIHVAWDALVFIVHKTNPLNDISTDRVREIYAGKIKDWVTLNDRNGPISVFIAKPRAGLSGVEFSLNEMVLNGAEPVDDKSFYSLASSGVAEQMVEKTPQGFAATGYSSAVKRDVKILKLDGIGPSRENIISGKYTLKRPLFILVNKDAKQEVRRFVDYVLSRRGQEFISSVGAISLLDMKRGAEEH